MWTGICCRLRASCLVIISRDSMCLLGTNSEKMPCSGDAFPCFFCFGQAVAVYVAVTRFAIVTLLPSYSTQYEAHPLIWTEYPDWWAVLRLKKLGFTTAAYFGIRTQHKPDFLKACSSAVDSKAYQPPPPKPLFFIALVMACKRNLRLQVYFNQFQFEVGCNLFLQEKLECCTFLTIIFTHSSL